MLDTDVASDRIKNTLDPALRAALAPHEVAITFVTVGELTRWSTVRDLGARRRGELQAYIAARVKIPGGSDVARTRGGDHGLRSASRSVAPRSMIPGSPPAA